MLIKIADVFASGALQSSHSTEVEVKRASCVPASLELHAFARAIVDMK
jgi:hypothetical protein